MSLRRTLATFLLLPLITFLEAGAWYGAHAVLFLFRIEDVELGGLGMDSADAISASATARLLVPVAILLGGLLGAAIGSQGLLVLGLLLAAPGMALIGMPAPWLGGLAAALLVLGHGLMRPGLMGSAAAALRGSEHLRTALIALIYTAINLVPRHERAAFKFVCLRECPRCPSSSARGSRGFRLRSWST